MNVNLNTHQMMLETRSQLKSISLGAPYVDTLKILQNSGPVAFSTDMAHRKIWMN
jgi:cystathionine gamma-synthase